MACNEISEKTKRKKRKNYWCIHSPSAMIFLLISMLQLSGKPKNFRHRKPVENQHRKLPFLVYCSKLFCILMQNRSFVLLRKLFLLSWIRNRRWEKQLFDEDESRLQSGGMIMRFLFGFFNGWRDLCTILRILTFFLSTFTTWWWLLGSNAWVESANQQLGEVAERFHFVNVIIILKQICNRKPLVRQPELEQQFFISK